MKRFIIGRWEPRVGPSAAIAYWEWQRLVLYGRFTIPIFMACFATAAHFHSVLFEIASYLPPVVASYFVVRYNARTKWRFAAIASQALGIEIVRGNFPPRGDDKYREWCMRNRIKPTPFR